MEYPLGNRNRDYAHKGIFKKMLTEFLGGRKKIHYVGFRNSLWKFATDLSSLGLDDIRYI